MILLAAAGALSILGQVVVLRELVASYGLTLWFWRSAIWRGDLPHLQLGRKLVVDSNDVDAWIERQKVIEGARG